MSVILPVNAILIGFKSRVAGVLARPVGILLKTEGLSGTLYAAAGWLQKNVRFLPIVRFLKKSQEQSTFATVVARSQSSLPPEDLRKMAGVRIADFESDVDHAQVRFAQQLARLIHPQVD